MINGVIVRNPEMLQVVDFTSEGRLEGIEYPLRWARFSWKALINTPRSVCHVSFFAALVTSSVLETMGGQF